MEELIESHVSIKPVSRNIKDPLRNTIRNTLQSEVEKTRIRNQLTSLPPKFKLW